MSKLLLVMAMGGLATVPMLPNEWLQLGVAGLSLTILFWITTRTHPKMIEDLNASHERNISAIVSNSRQDTQRVVEAVDDLKTTVAKNGEQQLELLRNHITRK